MPKTVLVLIASAAAFWTPSIGAQAEPSPRIHWYLERELERARPTEKLRVYAVVADRLGHDHWFPRVQRLKIDERRALVMAELKAHAAFTQRELLARLDRLVAEGEAAEVRSSWLGNFVSFEATPSAIREIARVDGLAEVRCDAVWPLEAVADAMPSSPAPIPSGPSNGTINTRANQVWALGYTGAGVVVMNADMGINPDHGDLVGRLWQNPGEIPANGIDDDDNGYVDDVYGWNFFYDNDDLTDSGGHGTLTAGILVGDGACSGTITGQAPGGRVMTGALGPPPPQTGSFTPLGEAAQWRAIQYAIQNGAHVQTSSYSYKHSFVPPPNYSMHRYIGDNSLAAGLIRTNSTGNNGALAARDATHPNSIPFNVSAPGNLPPPYLDPNQTLVGGLSGVIGVGAHDVNSNGLRDYSPVGPMAWHLSDVLSVLPTYPLANWWDSHSDYPWFGGTYPGLIQPDVTGPTSVTTTVGGTGVTCALGNTGGTSSATPGVAGAMMLWKGANMSLGPEDMAMILHQSAAPSGSVPGKENGWGAGRVDALAGLYLALCTHRVDGQPAWSVDHPVGEPLVLEVDTVPFCPTMIATLDVVDGVPAGDGEPGGLLYVGLCPPSGDLEVSISPGPVGSVLHTRAFTLWKNMTLESNPIEIRFVP